MIQIIQIIGGAGRVGMAIAQGILTKELDHVILTDIDKPKLNAELNDLSVYCQHLFLSRCASESDETNEASIYVFCCGKSRKNENVSRKSLFDDNWKIIKPYIEKIAKINPEAWIIIVSNPSTLIAKECMNYLPRVIPMGLLTDRIEESLTCVHGSHENNKKNDVGSEIFKVLGGSRLGVAGEVIALVSQLSENK